MIVGDLENKRDHHHAKIFHQFVCESTCRQPIVFSISALEMRGAYSYIGEALGRSTPPVSCEAVDSAALMFDDPFMSLVRAHEVVDG